MSARSSLVSATRGVYSALWLIATIRPGTGRSGAPSSMASAEAPIRSEGTSRWFTYTRTQGCDASAVVTTGSPASTTSPTRK